MAFDSSNIEVTIWPTKAGSKVKANGRAVFPAMGTTFSTKFMVIEGSNGLFVSLPSERYQDKEGNQKYSDTARVVDKDDNDSFRNFLLTKYNENGNGGGHASNNRTNREVEDDGFGSGSDIPF